MTTLLLRERAGATYLTYERSRIRQRLVARVRTWRLDTALANGACPDSNATLSLRAHRLISRTTRRQLSRQLQRLIREAERPAHRRSWGVPMCGREVRLAAEELEALADRLLSSAPVDARGMAQLQLLLTSRC